MNAFREKLNFCGTYTDLEVECAGAAHTLRFNQFTAFLDNYFTSTFPQKSKLFFSSDVYTVLTWSYVPILPFYRSVWVQTISIYPRLHFWNQTIFPIPSNFFRIWTRPNCKSDMVLCCTWSSAELTDSEAILLKGRKMVQNPSYNMT